MALALCLFVEFSFVAALLAVSGAFNDGRPTTTPPLAAAYLVVGFMVTIAVALRTWQMLKVAERGDLAELARMHLGTWTLIALLFSAMLPAVYLNAAAAAMPRE